MTAVPHAQFNGDFASDSEFDHPPGAVLARALEDSLRKRFVDVLPFENWRDCGWAIAMNLNGKSFEVYFAKHSPDSNEWLLAAAPTKSPSFIGRLLGRAQIEYTQELRAIAGEVHELLLGTQGILEIRWFLGGPPESVQKFKRPEELAWQ